MLDALTRQLGALTLGLIVGCSGATSGPPSSAFEPLAPWAPPSASFSPPVANAERKAKLQALVPKLDTFFRGRLGEVGATGAGVAILLEGEVVYLQGFGVRDIESKTPVDADTVFRIGSVSKTITALAVMRLRDQGKLLLDAPAATYLPALASIAAPTADSPPITVRHLLTMTSGFGYDDFWGAVTYGKSDDELAAFLARGVSFGGAAGERYRYSNLGFALLGKIVERVSGKSFESYVASDVFAPLGLGSTGYVTGAIPRERLATGYYRDGERLVPEKVESDGVFAPAGGAYTTIRDLARYAAFHLAAYPPRDDVDSGPVRRSTLREMHAGNAWARFAEDIPVLQRNPDGSSNLTAMSYGFGWAQNTTCLAETMVQHGGYEPGYYSVIRLLPRQGLGMVAISTTESIGRLSTFEAAMHILQGGGVFDAPAPTPSEALVGARDNMVRLLTHWDADLFARSFDPQSMKFSFLRELASDLERISLEQGPCTPDGVIVPIAYTQGRFRLACKTGAVELVAHLTPAVPPLLQNVEYRRELPVGEREASAARAIVQAIGGATLPADVFAPTVDRAAVEKRLAAIRGAYGTCELDAPRWSDGKGQATFRLKCAERPLELSLRVDPKTALVADVTSAQPRAYGAVCAE